MKRTLPLLCLIMALLIVIISMTTMSFSWFEPDVKKGIGLEFKDETKLRAQSCTINTYSKNIDGYYNESVVANANVTVTAGSVAYFKTVINNSSRDYDTVVSLYLPAFTPAASSSAKLCVAVPTNSVRDFTSAQTDLHIIRNAYVPNYVATDSNPGTLIVEWFVKCDVGSVTFNPSQVYLMYS